MWFPADDEVIAPIVAAEGTWEPETGWWLDQVCSPGMTVVNVGANVGYFVLWAAQNVGPAGRVVAVEPHPDNVTMLRRNVNDRRLRHVEIVAAAASSTSGTATLFVNEVNPGDHRVFDPDAAAALDPDLARASRGFTGRATTLQVPEVTLDEVLADRSVNVLLVDTQGHDHEVLAGARRLLERDRPVVLTEFTPAWIRAQGADPQQVLADYRSLGYRIGVWDAGAAPGAWSDGDIVAWAGAPGRWFASLELWPEERPLPTRVMPGAGFWTVERVSSHYWYWMIEATASVTVTGPPATIVHVEFDLIPPPGRPVCAVDVAETGPLRSGPGRRRIRVPLDAGGCAELPIAALTPGTTVEGDPRTLYAAIQDPIVMA